MNLKAFADKYDACLLQPAVFVTTIVAGIALVAMMMVTVYDIFLRLFLHRSLSGAFEITEFTLAVMAPFALAYCEKQRHHISVDLVMQFFSKRAQLWFDLVMSVLAALLYALVAWQCFVNVYLNKLTGLTSPVLLWPVWLFIIPSALGFLFLFLFLISHTLRVIAKFKEEEA